MQKVLTAEQLDLLRGLVEESEFRDENDHELASFFLKQINTQAMTYEDDRTYISKAKQEIRDKGVSFTIDFDAEVFSVDSRYAWVNGWLLVSKESIGDN